NERPPTSHMVFFKLSRKDGKVDDAFLRDRDKSGSLAIEASAGQHRGMLHGREIAVPCLPAPRGKSERISLGPAAGKDHILGRSAEELRHADPRRLDRGARGPALLMHRGWVAIEIKSATDRLAHLGAERSCRVIIEIRALVHR